jgi:hypothetical protein
MDPATAAELADLGGAVRAAVTVTALSPNS